MTALNSISKQLIFFVALAAMVLVLGCGPSAEKEKMVVFMQDFQKTLDAYTDAISKGDSDKKSEIEVKLNGLKDKWRHLKEETGTEVTPQTMEKYEAEFEKLLKKYAELSGK